VNAKTRKGEIETAPIRAAVLAHIAATGETYSQIALRAGWKYGGYGTERGDVTMLKRRLGMKPTSAGPRSRRVCTIGMTYETALRILEAIGADPVEYGL
jgi:hypothetical protein